MDDEILAEAARGLQALLDAVDRGELTATSLDELAEWLRIEGATEALKKTAEE